jgi:DNA-binding NarL/FixJ family response regulator
MAASPVCRNTGAVNLKASKVKVFVIEDSPDVRKRLVAMLGTVPGIEIAGEADSVRAGADGALAAAVDVILLDLQLVDGNGLDVLARVKPVRADIRVIVLSNLATAQYREASLAAGADVFLDKSHEFARVPEILRGWLAAPEAAQAS